MFQRNDTFCINLNRRPDRAANFNYEMGKIGGEYTRWAATDYRRFSFPQALKSTISGLTPSQYACYDSHISIMKHALSVGLDEITIFEDDCIFIDGFTEKYKIFMEEVPQDWQILRFGIYPQFVNSHKVISQNIRKLTVPAWGAHAYSLRKQSMEVFIKLDPIEADYLLYGILPEGESRLRAKSGHLTYEQLRAPRHHIPNYAPLENLCVQSGVQSDIVR